MALSLSHVPVARARQCHAARLYPASRPPTGRVACSSTVTVLGLDRASGGHRGTGITVSDGLVGPSAAPSNSGMNRDHDWHCSSGHYQGHSVTM